MPTLPDFRLETHFSKWEFKARYHLTASDAESLSLRDLLSGASDEERASLEDLWLGYTETFGAPDLREAIADTYEVQAADNVLCFAGASEGIFAANQVVLDADSHAIVVTPNYQSHETLPLAICEATGVERLVEVEERRAEKAGLLAGDHAERARVREDLQRGLDPTGDLDPREATTDVLGEKLAGSGVVEILGPLDLRRLAGHDQPPPLPAG